MEPTPFALQLAEPVAYAMGALHTALNQQVVFDPATSTRGFTLAMTDIGEIYFTPRLMEALSAAAPGVTISTVRNNTATSLRDELEAGHVDIAIGLLPQLKAGVFQRRLFLQRYVCIFSKAHPLARKRSVSLKDFSAADHVQVQAAGTGHGKADDVMAAQGIHRRIKLKVPHFVAIGHILRSSDMIATVPERLAQSIAEPFGLVWRPHPVALPQIAINSVLAREGAPRPGQPMAARAAVRQLRGRRLIATGRETPHARLRRPQCCQATDPAPRARPRRRDCRSERVNLRSTGLALRARASRACAARRRRSCAA